MYMKLEMNNLREQYIISSVPATDIPSIDFDYHLQFFFPGYVISSAIDFMEIISTIDKLPAVVVQLQGFTLFFFSPIVQGFK